MRPKKVKVPLLWQRPLEDLASLVDRSSQGDMSPPASYISRRGPRPLAKAPHPADPLPADVGRRPGIKPVPPMPHDLVQMSLPRSAKSCKDFEGPRTPDRNPGYAAANRYLV
jgi:hypothetical protein